MSDIGTSQHSALKEGLSFLFACTVAQNAHLHAYLASVFNGKDESLSAGLNKGPHFPGVLLCPAAYHSLSIV
jgi:hypothetical protein